MAILPRIAVGVSETPGPLAHRFHLLQRSACPLLHLFAIACSILHVSSNISDRHGPSNFGKRRRIWLPGDLPGAGSTVRSFCGELAKLLACELLLEISTQRRLDPNKPLIAVAPVLDHEACDGEKVNLTISRIRVFKTEELIQDRLARASRRKHRAAFGALF
jgi:hypothetical protein